MNEPRTAAGRELRTRLLLMFGAWQKLARSVPMHVPEIEDPKGWIAAIEQEAAATERQNTVERMTDTLHAEWQDMEAVGWPATSSQYRDGVKYAISRLDSIASDENGGTP